MTSLLETEHNAKLREIADQYRYNGYEVTVEPNPNVVPFDLGNYRPDLIVQKGDQAIIIEVKTAADHISVDQFQTVAEEVRRHSGWRFVLVTAQDISSAPLVEENMNQPTWAEISEQADHAQHLAELGEKDAAYLILWIAFERMLRLQVRSIALPVDRLDSSILIRQLYSNGELTIEQFDMALACRKIRNSIVHGFGNPDTPEAINRLNVLVRDLVAEWSSSGA